MGINCNITTRFSEASSPPVPQGRQTIAQCVSTGNSPQNEPSPTGTKERLPSFQDAVRAMVGVLSSLWDWKQRGCWFPVLTHWAILCRPCGTGGTGRMLARQFVEFAPTDLHRRMPSGHPCRDRHNTSHAHHGHRQFLLAPLRTQLAAARRRHRCRGAGGPCTGNPASCRTAWNASAALAARRVAGETRRLG